jgi:uncharacterized protein DUF2852
MGIVARLDDLGMPAWIALMVLSFIFFWPAGLVILAYLIGSGRMACWKHHYAGGWSGNGWQQANGGRGCGSGGRWFGGHGRYRSQSSGNRAFDEYRTETLKRLEEEQREFREFLDRLRFAKDKAEFDEFLAERRRRSESQPPPA